MKNDQRSTSNQYRAGVESCIHSTRSSSFGSIGNNNNCAVSDAGFFGPLPLYHRLAVFSLILSVARSPARGLLHTVRVHERENQVCTFLQRRSSVLHGQDGQETMSSHGVAESNRGGSLDRPFTFPSVRSQRLDAMMPAAVTAYRPDLCAQKRTLPSRVGCIMHQHCSSGRSGVHLEKNPLMRTWAPPDVRWRVLVVSNLPYLTV